MTTKPLSDIKQMHAGFSAALASLTPRQRERLVPDQLDLTPSEREALALALKPRAPRGRINRPDLTTAVYEIDDLERIAARIPADIDADEGYAIDSRSDHEKTISRAIGALKDHPRGAMRTLHAAAYDNLLLLLATTHKLKHFAMLEQILANAIRLSIRAQAPLRIPPILLNGPPGVGKSWFASRIGEALGLRPQVLSMATNSDIAVLTGLSPAWKGARIGRLATDILLGATASPFFVLDEIDKLRGHNDADPHNVLLTLLEPETARRFRDELLDIPFTAEHPYWVMTSNDRNMPAPFIDRLLVIDIPPLDEETRMMIARDLFDQANGDNNGTFAPPSDDVLAAIAKMGLRDAKRAILFAMGRAARDERLALETADVDASCRVIEENRETRAKIGFAAKFG